MAAFYDTLETRSDDERDADIAEKLPRQIEAAINQGSLSPVVDPKMITGVSDLARLPVLRKSDLLKYQKTQLPLGGMADVEAASNVFQSPGPIYEIGHQSRDWWRFGRFMHAAGIGAGDIIQNTFSYHFTPAGLMFENGAAAVGATVFPAGIGQTDQQVRAAADIGVTGYAGTPDFLKAILDRADENGVDLSSIKKAAVSGGPLFPQLRSFYADRGITCVQCYATADLGHVAYESSAMEGMIIDEGVLVEIVTPGTGNPVADGEVGEVLVTTFNTDYPLVRFATGDLSSFVAGISPCGRTNRRISGWRGRADQATKIKGMFVRPEQVAELVSRNSEIIKARVEVTHNGSSDEMAVLMETESKDVAKLEGAIRDALKLRGSVQLVPVGSLPKDGIVIQDKRELG
jgi:phenylacetate-CoA ligase